MRNQPTTDDPFGPFEDIVPEGAVAIQGLRIVTLLDEDGKQWIQWSHAGGPTIDEVTAMLARVSFLAQISEYIVTSVEEEDESGS